MKFTFLFLIMTVAIIQLAHPQSLKNVGWGLCYQNGDSLILVKHLHSGEFLQGYDLVDSVHIFLAYDHSIGEEPETICSIYDLVSRREQQMGVLYGTADAYFEYNRANGYVVYSAWTAIYIFKVREPSGIIVSKVSSKKVCSVSESVGAYWADQNRIAIIKWRDRSVSYCYPFTNH